MKDEEQGKPTDVRGVRSREQRRLLWVVLAFLVIVGGLVIAVVYGRGAAILGMACLLAGAGAVLLIYAFLLLIERLSR